MTYKDDPWQRTKGATCLSRPLMTRELGFQTEKGAAFLDVPWGPRVPKMMKTLPGGLRRALGLRDPQPGDISTWSHLKFSFSCFLRGPAVPSPHTGKGDWPWFPPRHTATMVPFPPRSDTEQIVVTELQGNVTVSDPCATEELEQA